MPYSIATPDGPGRLSGRAAARGTVLLDGRTVARMEPLAGNLLCENADGP